jgi:hypothetical protein
MNRTLIWAGMLLVILTALPAMPASTSPGTTSAYGSAHNWTLTSATVMISATISAGVRNRVLAIHGMATTNDTGNVQTVILLAILNGTFLYLEPTAAVGTYCESVYACTVTGVWWADLDALEAQYPGSFIGKPLKIDLIAYGYYPPTPSSSQVNGSLEVRLQTK